MKIQCCKDCAERHMGCHGTCDRYKAETAVLEEEKQARQRRYAGAYNVSDSMRVSSRTRKNARRRH